MKRYSKGSPSEHVRDKNLPVLRGGSYHCVFSVQMKNWEPLVLGPALAMDRIPGPVCVKLKFSSSNLLP